MIYLDCAATTFQKPPAVMEAIRRASEMCASPGRGGYGLSLAADELLFKTRGLAKEMFSLSDEKYCIFTKSATEALNIAIKGFTQPEDEVVISCLEHNAVVRPLASGGRRIKIANFPPECPEDAVIALERSITRRTRLCVCTAVSNVFGTMLPIREIGEICRRRGIPFVVDAAQAAGILELSVERIGADALCIPGHKGLYGPAGTGLLLLSGERIPRTLIEGGTGSHSASERQPQHLPDAFEAGTQNIWGIAGLCAGIEFVKSHPKGEILSAEQALCRRILDNLPAGYTAPGRGRDENQTGVLALLPVFAGCEEVAEFLSDAGICVRAGLCCAPLAHRAAHTFETGVLRISPGIFNTAADADALLRALSAARDALGG
ncbi:MAG: aminotransferase class V-fold PLP-dependent enzyme [Clostridia bacterium]|nr:aminotransferase class V-fold PLP-dependent enzyme [Clostridia bacterium]